jgi:hypothetical protein
MMIIVLTNIQSWDREFETTQDFTFIFCRNNVESSSGTSTYPYPSPAPISNDCNPPRPWSKIEKVESQKI